MLREDHVDRLARRTATDYLSTHKSQLPLVYLARVERMWDVYAPFQNVELNDEAEGRGAGASLAGLWFYWALLPFAAFGGWAMQRRGIPLSPIIGLAAAVTLTSMLSFGVTRYRLPADIGLVILASIGIDAMVVRVRRLRRAREATGEPSRAATTPDTDRRRRERGRLPRDGSALEGRRRQPVGAE